MRAMTKINCTRIARTASYRQAIPDNKPIVTRTSGLITSDLLMVTGTWQLVQLQGHMFQCNRSNNSLKCNYD